MTEYRCTWCGGSIINDNGEFKCLSCSREFKNPHRQGNPAWQKPHGNAIKKTHIVCTPKVCAKSTRKSPPTPAPVNPQFPAFNDKWQPETQVAWLSTYAQLYKREGGSNDQPRT